MRRFLPLIAVLSLAFAPAPFPRPLKLDPGKEDLKKMQGEWVEIARNSDGVPIESIRGNWSVMVVGDRISWRHSGDEYTRWRVTLDTSKSPRAMTLTNEAPADRVGVIAHSRYRVEGDTLTYCRAFDGALPASLEPGQGVLVSLYKRKRP